MHIAIINGPNLNLLGIRETELYGESTMEELERMIIDNTKELAIQTSFFQSNHEGEIIDYIQSLYNRSDGIIINPAAYTHTSIAIADALKAVNIPYIEVHLTNIKEREEYRRHSFIEEDALMTISGKGLDGYIEALQLLFIRLNA